MLLDILMDAVIDSIKLVPFLFVTYLIMEYLEHKTSNKSKKSIKKSGKWGPVVGGLLGAFPQCGFSVSATNLYVGRIISLGTLIAVYLSTSDEMIPVFLSEAVPLSVIFKLLGIKVIISIIVGICIDLILRKSNDEEYQKEIAEICDHEHCHCEEGIVKSALRHTASITLFIFLISLILDGLISVVGDENISNLILNKPVLGPIVASLVGLIPNCAASVIIAELYIGGMIGSGTMVAGLLVSAGVGLLVLFKMNNNIKENLKIVGILYSVGVIFGIVLELIGFAL